MKNLVAFVFIISLSSIAFNACKKTESTPACVAGTGGDLTLVLFPKHHGKSIPNSNAHLDSVYVKFNSQDYPGSLKNFDAVFVGEAGEDHVHLKGLKCGDYYFYAAGYDSTIKQRVKGGLPYSTSKTTGELDLDIAVSED